MASQFGQLFRISTFGESHGGGVGVVVDGCPPRLAISAGEIQRDLNRRRPGQNRLVTPRQERDQIEILSGVFEGQTLGTPIAMWVRNENTRSEDYEQMRNFYRPSHADYTTEAKFGLRNWQGGGRASARETVGRVAAGALARKLLADLGQIEVLAWVSKVYDIEVKLDPKELKKLSREQIEAHPTRCPHAETAQRMQEAIENARDKGNSLGGVVSCIARGVPPGLGEPVFDKLEADLAHALLSLPATKGFEIGSGFSGTDMTGIRHNDQFDFDTSSKPKDYKKSKQSGKPSSLRTKTNYSGGVQGGISNGEPIELRVAFKPTSTLGIKQKMASRRGIGHNKHPVRGRHDPCVLPRAVPMVEAMVCLVLADHWLRQRALDALPR